jgi:hypothetical protein
VAQLPLGAPSPCEHMGGGAGGEASDDGDVVHAGRDLCGDEATQRALHPHRHRRALPRGQRSAVEARGAGRACLPNLSTG